MTYMTTIVIAIAPWMPWTTARAGAIASFSPGSRPAWKSAISSDCTSG